MRLTLHTDYALRVLIYAGLKRDRLCTIPELVRHFGISRGHLMKVVHRLGLPAGRTRLLPDRKVLCVAAGA